MTFTDALLTPYLPESKGHSCAAIIVCPGGGYTHKADHEGSPVAHWLTTLGLAAFVLDYRVAPHKHPTPLQDAQRAIRFVKAQAAAYDLDPSRVGIMGFSAGGHLAASATVHYLPGDLEAPDPLERISSQPACLILGYPVITMGDYGHQGSRRNLLGEDLQPELVEYLSVEKQVSADMPPTFIWHTADDKGVPVENSLMFASALSTAGVKFELHVFAHGRHGLGLAVQQPEVAVWKDLCSTWLNQQGFA